MFSLARRETQKARRPNSSGVQSPDNSQEHCRRSTTYWRSRGLTALRTVESWHTPTKVKNYIIHFPKLILYSYYIKLQIAEDWRCCNNLWFLMHYNLCCALRINSFQLATGWYLFPKHPPGLILLLMSTWAELPNFILLPHLLAILGVKV